MPEVEHFILCILSVSVWAICSGSVLDKERDRSEKGWRAKISTVAERNISWPDIPSDYTSNLAEVLPHLSVDLHTETSLKATEGQLGNLISNLTVSDTAALDGSSNRTRKDNAFQEIVRILQYPLHVQEESRKNYDKAQRDILAYFHSIGNIVPGVPADGAEDAPTTETGANRGNTHSIHVHDTSHGIRASDGREKMKPASDVNKSIINSFMSMAGNRSTNYPLSGQHGNISQFIRHVTLLRESLEKFVGHKRVLRSSEIKSPDVETRQNATQQEFVYEDSFVGDKLSGNTDTSSVVGQADATTGASGEDSLPTVGSGNVSRGVDSTVAMEGDDFSAKYYTHILNTSVTEPEGTTYSGEILLQNITEEKANFRQAKVTELETHSRKAATYEAVSASSVNSINISFLLSSSDSTSQVDATTVSGNEDDTTRATFPSTVSSKAAEASNMTFPFSKFQTSESYSTMPSKLKEAELYPMTHTSNANVWADELTFTTSSILDQSGIETTSTETTSNMETMHSRVATNKIDEENHTTTTRLEDTDVKTGTISPEPTKSPEPAKIPEPTKSQEPAKIPEPTHNGYSPLDTTPGIMPGTSSVPSASRSTSSLYTSSNGIIGQAVDMGSFTLQVNSSDVSLQFTEGSLDAYTITTASLNSHSQTSGHDKLNTYSFSSQALTSVSQKFSDDIVNTYSVSTQSLSSESQKSSGDTSNTFSTLSLSSENQKHDDDYMGSINTFAPNSEISQQSDDYLDISTTPLIISRGSDNTFLDTNSVTTAPLKLDSTTTSSDGYSNTDGIVTIPLTDSVVTQQYHEGYLDTSSSTNLDKFDSHHPDNAVASSATQTWTSSLVLKLEPGTEHPFTTTDEFGLPMNNSSITSKNGAVYSTLPAAVAVLDWDVAKRTWAYAWEIHVYVFGSLFGVFGLYSLLSLVRLWWIRCLLPSGYFIWLHFLLMVVCFTRSFYLLYDGYGSSGSFHVSVNHFLYSVTFPCLTAAFSSLFYWLLQTTQVTLITAFVQRLQVLMVVIAVHFVISLTTDVLVGVYSDIHILLFVCHAYGITWSLFLYLGYVCTFRKLHSHAVKQKDDTYTPPRTPPYSAEKSRSSLTLNSAVKATLCVAICGLVVTGLDIYAIVEVYKVFTPGRPAPWTWWIFHTVLRMVEICMCLILIYIISLPRRYHRSGAGCGCGLLCAPCSEICCCRHSVNQPKSRSCFKHFHRTPAMNSFHNRYKESFTENSSKELLECQLTDKIHPVQPIFGSRPNSLLIIEDGYVRFQTEYDINKIVDSCNDLSQRPVEEPGMGTFLCKDGVLNTGYTLNPGEDSQATSNSQNSQTRNNSDVQVVLMSKSRNSSVTNSDYFRVPSSVSLADSIENELEKAFRSFKMDTSTDDDSASKPSDLTVMADVQKVRSPDAVSAASMPKSRTAADTSRRQPVQQHLDNEPVTQSKGQYQLLTSQHHMLTLPSSTELTESDRTAKGDDSFPDPHIQMKPWEDTSPGATDSADTKYLHLLDVGQKHDQAENSEDSDYDSECNFPISTRRPSEGQGCQAAVLTSLLKSWETESGENIDV